MQHSNNKDILRVVVLCGMLLSANIYTLLFADALFECPLDRLWYILVVAVGYIAGLLLFRLRTFFIIQGFAQMLFLPIEVSSLYLNGQPVSMQFMYWIIATNRGEATELLLSLWWLVLIVLLVWGVYGWMTARIPASMRLMNSKRWIPRTVLVAIAIALLLIHWNHLNKNYIAPDKTVYAQIYAWSFGMRVGKVFPYDIYLQTFRAYKHMREIDGIASIADYRFGIAPRQDTDSALYVLVIGEAARYENFSLNGVYEHETNPLLAQQKNLVFFPHAYAEANATDLSLPLMITRASAEDPIRAYNEKTVAGAFQEAGFKAAWISAKASPIRYMQHVLNTLDTVWVAPGEIMDEQLFLPYGNLLQTPSVTAATSLIVLHTKGSHLNYQDRYPDQFAVFQPCLSKGATNGTFDKLLMTNTYDNSILYTDYILHALIQTLDSTERCACLIYMPDHGENLCDDERKLWAHGSYDGSEWEYHVPLIVWYSDRFAQAYPDKVAALQANTPKQVTAQVLFHTLCDMANLHEVVDEKYSLLSDSLISAPSVCALNGKGEIRTLMP